MTGRHHPLERLARPAGRGSQVPGNGKRRLTDAALLDELVDALAERPLDGQCLTALREHLERTQTPGAHDNTVMPSRWHRAHRIYEQARNLFYSIEDWRAQRG